MSGDDEVETPYVSVVVPTFNRRASLQRLLEVLAQQTCSPAAFEVIVVDDGSTDGTVDMVRQLDRPYTLRLLAQAANAGPAAARNFGVGHARGALILFLDDDVVPLSNLIARHVQWHEAQPGAVVIGSMSPPQDSPRPAWVRWEEDLLDRQYRDLIAERYPCTPRQFYTANASLLRAEFQAAGGFDSRFKRAEDVELAYRLRNRGARFIFDPHAQVIHYASRSFQAWCRTPYQYGRYDVVMEREKGHEALRSATHEFHRRRALNRFLTRLCVGRRPLVKGMVLALGGVVFVADHLGAYRAAAAALSAIFNLLYWQGACDELGHHERLWGLVAATAPASP